MRYWLGYEGPHVVAEVLEEENEALLDGDRVDAIVSPMIVSYILSQVALEPELGLIFRGTDPILGYYNSVSLTRAGGRECGAAVFRSLLRRPLRRGETAIGVVTSSAEWPADTA